jgi:hypothetical protein
MRRRRRRRQGTALLALAAATAAAVAAFAVFPVGAPAQGRDAAATATYTPGPHNIQLPEDWERRFIRYAAVDRPDRKIIRSLYVNPEAFAAARPGQPLPDGTFIVMADHRARVDAKGAPLLDQAGRFIPEGPIIAIGVQEKRAGWGEGYPPEKRNGEWEYARFNPDGTRHPNLDMNGCFACHIGTRAAQDFAFNFWDYVQARR